MTVNKISLGYALLVGQNKQFEDVTLGLEEIVMDIL